MKRWVLLMLLAAACTKAPLFPGRPRSATEAGGGNHHGDGGVSTETIPEGVNLYATAVRFAQGYDWQRDTVPAGDETRILLLKNGAEILSVPAGRSASPERHRVRDGHLWTDYCEDGWTILCRDGEEIYRWTPEESLKGFILQEGNVFTLGQRVGETGFSFRRNGAVLYEDAGGTILGEVNESGWDGGALAMDGEHFCYCYRASVRVGSDKLTEYHFMKDLHMENTLPAGSVKTLYDWRSVGGVLYRSELRERGYYLVAGGKDIFLSRKTPHLAKLMPWKGEVFSTGYYDSPYVFWVEGIKSALWHDFETIIINGVFTDGDDYSVIETDNDCRIKSVISAVPPEDAVFSAGNYHLMSPSCGYMLGGCLALALTNLDGTEHLLCVDDTVAVLNFNGYLSSIRIE